MNLASNIVIESFVGEEIYTFSVSACDEKLVKTKYGYCIRLRGNDKFVLATYGKYNGQVLARLLLNAPKNKQVDHIDGNPLNNTRENLRLCSQSQNNMNRVKVGELPKGVSIHMPTGRYRARIQIEGTQLHLGLFDTLEQAEAAYLRMANILFREFASHVSREAT